jgi:hypothetical protein
MTLVGQELTYTAGCASVNSQHHCGPLLTGLALITFVPHWFQNNSEQGTNATHGQSVEAYRAPLTTNQAVNAIGWNGDV